ncbi:MAG TPA: CmcJ/NvfI family oxidoreductase [Acidimicrobiales bacterium]|nr:CmcJ/NvfI family oxidoreductase [Acidimicrobiales bacterium]
MFCRTTLNYVAASGGHPMAPAPVEVDVFDARAASTSLPGWRACGFERVAHASSVRDWTDDDEIASVHYAEIEALARSLTGCDFALVSDHVKRTAENVKRTREQSPVRLVHSDFAADYEDVARGAYVDVRGRGAATLARSGRSAEDVSAAARIVMMQFWRNLGAPKMDLPVAFCDARTVTPAEGRPFHYTGYVAGGRSFDALAIVATPEGTARHRWYVYPSLAADEVVAFRTYDTSLVAAGSTWFTPHSAFPDPDVPAGQPPRFSIELRVMCVFSSPSSFTAPA